MSLKMHAVDSVLNIVFTIITAKEFLSSLIQQSNIKIGLLILILFKMSMIYSNSLRVFNSSTGTLVILHIVNYSFIDCLKQCIMEKYVLSL